LLESACAAPRATFDGRMLHANVYEVAAAYGFYIVGNHPFLDGNKRAGLGAALYFLQLNGIEVLASRDAMESVGLRLARGELKIAGFASFLKRHAKREP
jgi:death on curing protein